MESKIRISKNYAKSKIIHNFDYTGEKEPHEFSRHWHSEKGEQRIKGNNHRQSWRIVPHQQTSTNAQKEQTRQGSQAW